MKVIVSNIQRFCLNDGSGIRTTVFFKGCNLSCPWCANPENINFNIEKYIKDDKIGVYGYEIELEDLEEEILKDQVFYDNDGGVTFSGGEPILQIEKIEPLLKSLKEKNINICIETALTVQDKYIDIALKYINEFYIDIKILDDKNIDKIKGNVELFKTNVKKVLDNNSNVIFRIPLVKEYTLTKENKKAIIDFLNEIKASNVEIFAIHRLAENKYKSLGKEMPIFEEIKNEELQEIKKEIEENGIKCKIIKI